MSRRLSSQEASEAARAHLQRTRGSRCSLGHPNSSLSQWYISDRNGVSLSSMTIRSPCQPHSVSWSTSGISYPTSVSSSIIPRTRTRLISASLSGGGPVIRGGGADSMPHICRPLRAETDTAITGCDQPFPMSVRVLPSQGRLGHSRSSSCGGGHAFVRHTTRISVRLGPMTSNPAIAERTRMSAGVGRRATRRTVFAPAEASVSVGGAAQRSTTTPPAARLADFKPLDAAPLGFPSAKTDVSGPLGPIPTMSTSSHEEVGRALFSDWAHRKQEPFADVYKGGKDFFADLVKQRRDGGHQPTALAPKAPTVDSSHSELFMTTISEMGERDVPETSAENYMMQSATVPSMTTTTTAIEDKAPLQTMTALTYPTSSEFDSYEFSKTQAPEAPSEGAAKETPQDKAESPGGNLVEYVSFDSQSKEGDTASSAPAAVENMIGTSIDISTTKTGGENKEALGESLPSEKLQDIKDLELTQASSAHSVEAASARTEVPIEISSYGYVPTLAESTFEAPGATSEEHQLLPTSYEGPFTSMASDMTEFPAFDMSKTQEPDVSRQLTSLKEPYQGEVQMQLVERPQADESAQVQATGSSHDLEVSAAAAAAAAAAGYPSRECETFLPPQSAVLVQQAETEKLAKEIESEEIIPMHPHQDSGRASSEQTAEVDTSASEKQGGLEDVTEQRLLQTEPQKESDADFVAKDVHQISEVTSSEGSVAVSDATTAEKHETLPLTASAKLPIYEGSSANEEISKEVWNVVARQSEPDSELMSSEQGPLPEFSLTRQPDDFFPQPEISVSGADENVSAREIAKESEEREIVPRQEDEGKEPAPSESTALVEVMPTAKHEGIPFAELTTEHADEDHLAKQEHDRESWSTVTRHPEYDSELTSSQQAALSDVSVTQQPDYFLPQAEIDESRAAEKNIPFTETAKQSELTDIVLRQEDRDSELASSLSSASVETKPREKRDDKPFTETAMDRMEEDHLAKPEHRETWSTVVGHPDQDKELISSEQPPLSEVSMTQQPDDFLPYTKIAASGTVEATSVGSTSKESELRDIVPRQQDQGSEPASFESSAAVEAKPTEKHDGIPFTEPTVEHMDDDLLAKEEHDKKTWNIVASQPEPDSELIPSEQRSLPDFSVTRLPDDFLPHKEIAKSATDEDVSVRETANQSRSSEIAPRQEDESKEPMSSESSALIGTKPAEMHDGIPFTEPTVERMDEDLLAKEEHDKETWNIVARQPEPDSELISSEQGPLPDFSVTRQPDDYLPQPEIAASGADENVSVREIAKESESNEIVPTQEDESKEPVSSESSALIGAKPAEKHDGIPFTEPTVQHMDEDLLAKEEHDKQTWNTVANQPEPESELISSEQGPLLEFSLTRQPDDFLLHKEIATSGTDEDVSMRETAKESESRDFMPRHEGERSEPASSDSAALVEVKPTAKHEGVPLADLPTEPTDENVMRQKPEKETWHTSPKHTQQGEQVSTEPTPLSDVSATQQSDDSLLQHSIMPPHKENIMLQDAAKQEYQGSEPASSEISSVVEVKAIEKPDGAPFAELMTEPTDEAILGRRGLYNEDMVNRPSQQGEIVSTEPTPLSDVTTTQHTNDSLQSSEPTADENFLKRETDIKSGLTKLVTKPEDQGSEFPSSEHAGVVVASTAEKRGIAEAIEYDSEAATDEYLPRKKKSEAQDIIPREPDRDYVQTSNELSTMPDTAAEEKIEGTTQPSTDIEGYVLPSHTDKESDVSGTAAKKKEESSDLTYRTDEVGPSPLDGYKEQYVETSLVPITEDEIQVTPTLLPAYAATRNKLEEQPLIETTDFALDDSFLKKHISELPDIEAGQLDKSSDLVPFEGTRAAGMAEEEKCDESNSIREVTAYALPKEQKEAGTVDETGELQDKADIIPTAMVPSTLETSQVLPAIEYISTVAEKADRVSESTAAGSEQAMMTRSEEYLNAAPVEAVSREQQPAAERSVDYAAQFWDSETMQLALTHMWTPEGGAVTIDKGSPGTEIIEVMDTKQVPDVAASDGPFSHSESERKSFETSETADALQVESKLDSSAIPRITSEAANEASASLDKAAVNYAAQFWDGGALKLQLMNMWTPEGGAIIAEGVQSDDEAQKRAPALSDQYSTAQKQPTDSWESPSKEEPAGALAPLQFEELHDSPVKEIHLEPGYLKQALSKELLSDLKEIPAVPEVAATEEQAEGGATKALHDERPTASYEEGGVHTEVVGEEPTDASFGGAATGSAYMGALPEPVLPTSLERLLHPDHSEAEQHPKSATAEIFHTGRPAVSSGQVDALGLEFTSKEKVSAPVAAAEEEVMPALNVMSELTWSVTSDRATDHLEGEPETTEEATFAAEQHVKDQLPKKEKDQEIEQPVSGSVCDKLDDAANEERGPLLSVMKTEKHFCEKTSERILKRYGDTKPMESVTGARESFVIAETETQFFDSATGESMIRNSPEKARAEAESSQSKFESDVFLEDLIGKNAIEPTEPSQPCDYVARPLNVFDDVVAAAATSTSEAVSWKHSPSEDGVIEAESKSIKEIGPSCSKTEVQVQDNVLDHINRADEASEDASLKSPSDPLSPPSISPLATFSPFPEAEFTSLTYQGQYVPCSSLDSEKRGAKLLACTKDSDPTIKTVGASQCPSLTGESNLSVDEMLRTLHKPPLYLSDGVFQTRLVNVNTSSVQIGKYALPYAVLPDSVNKCPFYSASSTSEPDSKDKDFCQEMGQVPAKLVLDACSDKPADEAHCDAMFFSRTGKNGTAALLRVEGEPLPKREDNINKNESGLIDTATYQELPAGEDASLVEIEDEFVQSEALSAEQGSDLQPLFRPCDGTRVCDYDEQLAEEQSRCRAQAVDCTSLFYSEDMQALSDEQVKLLSANLSLQAGFAPFKIGTPPLETPPLATPPVETPPAEQSTTEMGTSKQVATIEGQYAGSTAEVNALCCEYRTPLKHKVPCRNDTALVCDTDLGAQESSTGREPCYPTDKTISSCALFKTDVATYTKRSEQACHQRPTITEGKQPPSVAEENPHRPGFAADLHSWFHREDPAMAEYPISAQDDSTDEDSSGFEFPPWASHSENKPEEKRAFHAIDVPLAAPNKVGAGGNVVATGLGNPLWPTYSETEPEEKRAFHATDVPVAAPNTVGAEGKAVAAGFGHPLWPSYSETEPEEKTEFYATDIPIAPLNGVSVGGNVVDASLLQELEGPFAVDFIVTDSDAKNTGECAQTTGASGADQGTVTTSRCGILAYTDPCKPVLTIGARVDGVSKPKAQKRRLSFSDEVLTSNDVAYREKHNVAPTAKASPPDNILCPSGKQETYTILEEEYSMVDKQEEPAAVGSDTYVMAGESDEFDNGEQQRAGSVTQCCEFLASTLTQSAPNDTTTANNATWSAENRDDGRQRPVYVETAFEDAKGQLKESLLSVRRGSDYSDDHFSNIGSDETAPLCRRSDAVKVENNMSEISSSRELDSSVPLRAAISGSLGVPSTERKTSLSSVSVGYTQEPQVNDDNTSSYGGDALDDLDCLKMRLFGSSRSQGPGNIPDDEIRKNELTSTLSASHIFGVEAPFPWEHTRSFDSETVYAPAIVLKDDAYRMSVPSSAVTEGVADAVNKYDVPPAGNDTMKSESVLSATFGDALSAKECTTRQREGQQDANATTQSFPMQLERSRNEVSQQPAIDDRDERLLKSASAEDNTHDAEIPDADDENPKFASRCEELRFENFRTVVERMADLSSRSETSIVYESFVAPAGKVSDMLGSVYYDTAFKVRVVDDYDLTSIMYDRWNDGAASVAPTIKTFWTYSPHTFLMAVDESGTHCGIISAVVFEDEQAFCAANSVKTEFLAEGTKRQLWDALLSVQCGKNLFTVVPAEQVGAYYRQLGFYTSARGLILHGKLASSTDLTPLGQVSLPDGIEIVKFRKQMYSSLVSFDKSTLGFGRKRFWKMTLREGPISFRVALQGGSGNAEVCGYAGLQNDVNGVPVVRWLVASDGQVAVRLLHNLLSGSYTFRQRGAWMALYARSHASAALLRHLDTSGFEPWMLLFNRREPFLQYKNIAVLTYI